MSIRLCLSGFWLIAHAFNGEYLTRSSNQSQSNSSEWIKPQASRLLALIMAARAPDAALNVGEKLVPRTRTQHCQGGEPGQPQTLPAKVEKLASAVPSVICRHSDKRRGVTDGRMVNCPSAGRASVSEAGMAIGRWGKEAREGGPSLALLLSSVACRRARCRRIRVPAFAACCPHGIPP